MKQSTPFHMSNIAFVHVLVANSSSAASDQHQVSPNNISTLSNKRLW